MTSIKNIPPNRTVALLTPLVFAPLAGAISVAVAKYAPGVTIDQGSLEAVFIAGATIALGPAGLWLKGWQAQEQHAADAPHDGADDRGFDDDLTEPLADELALDHDDEPEPELDVDEDVDEDFGEDEEDDELMALLGAPEE